MNILMLSWRGPGHPNYGGAETATLEHLKHWSEKGNNVYWFTSSFRGASPKEVVDGVQIVRYGGQIFGVHIAAFLWYFFGKHPKFDLVVDQFHGIPFFTPLYVRSKKLAYIHEVAKEIWLSNAWPKPFNLIPALFGSVFEPLLFIVFYRNVRFMTVSNSTREDLISWGINSRNIAVIENGVTVVKPKRKISKEKTPTVLFLGALSKDKGIFDAIKAFGLINKLMPKCNFWVIGKADGGIKEEMDRRLKELNIIDKTKYWGFVSEAMKFELLARAHIMINPSIREGWGLVNIEANAMGTPVVGYNVAGVVDSVKDNTTGILVDKHDTNSLAQKVVGLLSSKDYQIISKNCEKWAEEFDWKEASHESLILIKKIYYGHTRERTTKKQP